MALDLWIVFALKIFHGRYYACHACSIFIYLLTQTANDSTMICHFCPKDFELTSIIYIFSLQIWDPFTGDIVQQLESSKYSPVIALTTLPYPSTVVVTATTDSTLRYCFLP